MKITPIAGANMAGVTSPGQPAASPDRREAAKQAFLGQTPTRIAQSDTPVDPNIAAQALNVRKLTMKTNASPIQQLPAESVQQEAAVPPVDTNSAISNDSVETKPAEVRKPISPQFAELARQRRALQVREQQLAAKEKAIAEGNGSAVDLAKLKAEPLRILQEAGVSYDDLTKAIMADPSGQNQELIALKAKIDALEKGFDTKLSERDAQAERQVLQDMGREVRSLVAQGDEYGLIRETRSQNDVVELIHRTWKKTGEVLDIAEAARLVENELLEDISKVAALKKVQGRLVPQQQQSQPQAQTQQQGLKTLTNRDSAKPAYTRKERAIAAALGQKLGV